MLASSNTGQTFDTLLASVSAEDLEEIAGLMAEGKVETAIDREYALEDIAEAIRHSESGRARGKIIIRVSD